jgi:hypothetical protein
VTTDDVRAAGPSRWAAAAALAVALPVTPLVVAATRGSAALVVIAAGAACLAALAAWLGPRAWPGTPAAPAVERVMVTAMIAWAAALDAAVAGVAVRGGSVAVPGLGIAATAAAYVAGSAWSVRTPGEVWWRWPVACTVTAAVWVVCQAAEL